MSEEERKIGIYKENEIFEYLTNREGSFLGRSMYDAIMDKICALETENMNLQQEKQDLIKYLEDKVREYTPNLKTQWGYTEDGYRYENINAEVYTKRPHETYQEILDRIKGE